MKTKINKYNLILGIIFTVFASGIFMACSSDDLESDLMIAGEHDDNIVDSKFETVGSLHNETLDYVLEELVKKRTITKVGKQSPIAYSTITNICYEFVEKKGFVGINSKATRTNSDFKKIDESDFEFSQVGENYFNEMNKIVLSSRPNTIENTINKLIELEKKVANNTFLNTDEKDEIMYGIVTCRYSAKYWADNYNKWELSLYGTTNSIIPRTKTNEEHNVSTSWWSQYGHVVVADGWWAMQSCNQSMGSCNPYYIIGATIAGSATGSVLTYLSKH